MFEDNIKIVDFDLYCPSCKSYLIDEDNEPCATCLETPARENSHKPEKWEEK